VHGFILLSARSQLTHALREETPGDAAVCALGKEAAVLGGVTGAVHDAEDLLRRAVVGERQVVAGDDVPHGQPLGPQLGRHHQALVLHAPPPQRVPEVRDACRDLRHPAGARTAAYGSPRPAPTPPPAAPPAAAHTDSAYQQHVNRAGTATGTQHDW
jgi:hypothetical protein